MDEVLVGDDVPPVILVKDQEVVDVVASPSRLLVTDPDIIQVESEPVLEITTEPSVVLVQGTFSAPGPEGPEGPPGPEGPEGPVGPQGSPGPVELYDSPTAIVAPGSFPYLRFERDVDGDVQAIYLGTAS